MGMGVGGTIMCPLLCEAGAYPVYIIMLRMQINGFFTAYLYAHYASSLACIAMELIHPKLNLSGSSLIIACTHQSQSLIFVIILTWHLHSEA